MRRSLVDWLLLRKKRNPPSEPATAPASDPHSTSEEADPQLEALDRILAVADDQPAGTPTSAALPSEIAGYEVRDELGRGGMGIVYRVWDPVLRRVVALKMIRPAAPWLSATEVNHLAGRFQREAQVLAQLKHEAIVPIYEAKLHEGQPYFVMECVAGGSLAKHLAELTAAGPKAIVPLIEKVARAVQYAHSHGRGVLHRDLKPANILLNEQGQPLVSDFGLAKLLDVPESAEPDTRVANDTSGTDGPSPREVSTRWTFPGCQPGTPPYMAPEQFDASFGKIGPATDVWALGVILYELLTGQKPFSCRTREELREQVCRGELVRPRALCPRLGRRLEAVVLRCLAKSPPQRYPTAGALADALAAWRKRRRWPLLAGAALALAAVVLAITIGVTPADPDKTYLREAARLEQQLDRTGNVVLVSPDSPRWAVYTIRAGQEGTVVTPLDDGLNVYSLARCCLVEFLPRVAAPRYRIVVKMRLDRPLHTQEGEFGVYCRHAAFATDQGLQHSFHALYFEGFDPLPGSLPARQEIQSSLRQRLFCHLNRPTDLPFRDYHHNVLRKTVVQSTEWTFDRNDPWYTIEMVVQPQVVTARYRIGSGDWVNLGPLLPRDHEAYVRLTSITYPDLANVLPEQWIGSALGVYVRHSVCTVQQFEVHVEPNNVQN